MTVRLRAHHLLCVLTYAGKGYSPAFVANFDRIAGRIAAGEGISIVAGPDDVCAPLLETGAPHCVRPRAALRDRRAAAALTPVLDRPIAPGAAFVLETALIDQMREAFARGTSRAACAGCLWFDLCTGIVQARFEGTRLPAGIHGEDAL